MARFFTAVSGKIASTFKHSTGSKEIQLADHNGKITYCRKVESPWAQRVKTEKKVISFNANGGSGEMPNVSTTNSVYTLPECGFTAPQYKKFSGWSKNPAGPVITDKVVPILTDTVFYAIWEPIKCTVTFGMNGASGAEMPPVIVNAGEKYYPPEPTFTPPTKTVYAGWKKDNPETGALVRPGYGTTIKADTKLYAQWAPLYDVRLHRGSFATEDSPEHFILQTIEDSQFPLPRTLDETPIRAKEDYEFTYWTASDGSPLESFLVSVRGDIDLYAAYRAI